MNSRKILVMEHDDELDGLKGVTLSEEEVIELIDEVIPSTLPPTDIVTFTELRSCAELKRMVDQAELEIDPDFQRHSVWDTPMQARFVDSLSKNFPIPSMCLAYDYPKEKRIVVDGRQRIQATVKFLQGRSSEWKIPKLDDISDALSGKNVSDIANPENSDSYQIFKRIQNITIPITVIRCDLDNSTHEHYVRMIFHRLNTGGLKLNNQEIRNSLYAGPFNSSLRELVQMEEWKEIIRYNPKKDRMISEEMALRCLAFSDNSFSETYTGQLSDFLNRFMKTHQRDSKDKIETRFELFKETVKLIHKNFIAAHKKPETMRMVLLEATFVGIAENLEYFNNLSVIEANQLLLNLKSNPIMENTSGLYKTTLVKERLTAARHIMSAL